MAAGRHTGSDRSTHDGGGCRRCRHCARRHGGRRIDLVGAPARQYVLGDAVRGVLLVDVRLVGVHPALKPAARQRADINRQTGGRTGAHRQAVGDRLVVVVEDTVVGVGVVVRRPRWRARLCHHHHHHHHRFNVCVSKLSTGWTVSPISWEFMKRMFYGPS